MFRSSCTEARSKEHERRAFQPLGSCESVRLAPLYEDGHRYVSQFPHAIYKELLRIFFSFSVACSLSSDKGLETLQLQDVEIQDLELIQSHRFRSFNLYLN